MSKKLIHWAKWCREYEGNLERVQEAVRSGQALLTDENLYQLYELVKDPKDCDRDIRLPRNPQADCYLDRSDPTDAAPVIEIARSAYLGVNMRLMTRPSDDIAWMYLDQEGLLRAINPEPRCFSVIGDTNHEERHTPRVA